MKRKSSYIVDKTKFESLFGSKQSGKWIIVQENSRVI